MKKSTMIASCLVNSNMIQNMEDAENAVKNAFRGDFSQNDFNIWNQEIPDDTAKEIIKNVGKATTINITNFIKDFWE